MKIVEDATTEINSSRYVQSQESLGQSSGFA